MTEAEIRTAVLDALADVAPEVDGAALAPDVELREQVEVDSMDMLNFVIGIHTRTGVDVPEADYPKLATLDGCIDYLRRRLAAATPTGGTP